MSTRRVLFRNGIYKVTADPRAVVGPDEFRVDPSAARQVERTRLIVSTVQAAINRLEPDEQLVIREFWYQGKTYRQIAAGIGRPRHKIETLHRRAQRKLRRLLANFVEQMWGIRQGAAGRKCLICESPVRSTIDRIIAARDKTSTWRPVMQILREEFGLQIRSPQTLISHQKFHQVLNWKESDHGEE